MFALISRILKLSGRYKGRIQGAFVLCVCRVHSVKNAIFMAFIVFKPGLLITR